MQDEGSFENCVFIPFCIEIFSSSFISNNKCYVLPFRNINVTAPDLNLVPLEFDISKECVVGDPNTKYIPLVNQI